jgi:hypothetical protein
MLVKFDHIYSLLNYVIKSLSCLKTFHNVVNSSVVGCLNSHFTIWSGSFRIMLVCEKLKAAFLNIANFPCLEQAMFVYRHLWTSVQSIFLIPSISLYAADDTKALELYKYMPWQCYLGISHSASPASSPRIRRCSSWALPDDVQGVSVTICPRHQSRQGFSSATVRLQSWCHGRRCGGWGKRLGPHYKVPTSSSRESLTTMIPRKRFFLFHLYMCSSLVYGCCRCHTSLDT